MASVAFSQVEVKLHQDNRELRSLSVSIGYNFFFIGSKTMFCAGGGDLPLYFCHEVNLTFQFSIQGLMSPEHFPIIVSD